MKNDIIADSYKKGDMIELDIIDMSTTGEGIGKTGAFTWFVKDSVVGDRISASVMKTKKSYGYARLNEVIKPSKLGLKADYGDFTQGMNAAWQEPAAVAVCKICPMKVSLN